MLNKILQPLWIMLLCSGTLLYADIDNLEFIGHNEVNPYHLMDVEVVGNTAYIANGLGTGFEVYDIADPANPSRVYTDGPDAWRIDSYGDTLAASFCRRDGVVFYDISGSLPVQVGWYNPPGNTEAIEGGDILGVNYYCAVHQNGIYVLDISNISSPLKIDEFAPDSAAVWNVVVKDSFLLAANGRFGLAIIGIAGGLHLSAALALPGCANDINLDGNTAAISLGDHGFATIDITDPSNPVLLDTIGTEGCVWGAGIAHHMVVCGSWRAMEIFDISNPGDIQRIGWENTKTWALGTDIRNDSLIVVADWRGMSCYQFGSDPDPDIDLYPQVIDFGAVSGSQDTAVVVRNTGTSTLNVTSITVPSGITTNPSSFTVLPGDSITVTVTANGSYTFGELYYQCNDPDESSKRQEVYQNNSSFPQYGSPAPDFNLFGTDGQYHSISENAGKVIFLEFGGAW